APSTKTSSDGRRRPNRPCPYGVPHRLRKPGARAPDQLLDARSVVGSTGDAAHTPSADRQLEPDVPERARRGHRRRRPRGGTIERRGAARRFGGVPVSDGVETGTAEADARPEQVLARVGKGCRVALGIDEGTGSP